LSSSFVREPRTEALIAGAGAGKGGPDVMKRFAHGMQVCRLEKAAGKRITAGRKRVTIIDMRILASDSWAVNLSTG
jgi:hypothetical protein